MTAQINAELLKIRSTRTTIALALAMLALVLLFTLLSGLLTKAPHLATSQDQIGMLSVGSLAGVLSALAGVMLITSEYRYGTIRPTFLFTPRRSRVLAAKLAAGLLAGIAFGAAGEAPRFRHRLRHPRCPWHPLRAQHGCDRARARRNDRCECALGCDRRRRRRNRP